jgi:hypothetical protein
MTAPREIFEQRGCVLSGPGTLWAAVRCSDHVNFPAPIEPMLRGHFI